MLFEEPEECALRVGAKSRSRPIPGGSAPDGSWLCNLGNVDAWSRKGATPSAEKENSTQMSRSATKEHHQTRSRGVLGLDALDPKQSRIISTRDHPATIFPNNRRTTDGDHSPLIGTVGEEHLFFMYGDIQMSCNEGNRTWILTYFYTHFRLFRGIMEGYPFSYGRKVSFLTHL